MRFQDLFERHDPTRTKEQLKAKQREFFNQRTYYCESALPGWREETHENLVDILLERNGFVSGTVRLVSWQHTMAEIRFNHQTGQPEIAAIYKCVEPEIEYVME